MCVPVAYSAQKRPKTAPPTHAHGAAAAATRLPQSAEEAGAAALPSPSPSFSPLPPAASLRNATDSDDCFLFHEETPR
jgi:hypothetical protein